MNKFYGSALYCVRVTKPNGEFYFVTGYRPFGSAICLYEIGSARKEANAINAHSLLKAEVVPVTLSFGEPL